MPTGTVKWFDERQAFGYIVADEGGPEVFVHRSVIQADGVRSLSEGQAVEYELEMSRKGPRAVSVKPVGSSSSGRAD